MGIYNQIQIKQLQSQLESQASVHDRLVEVVEQQGDLVHQLDKAVVGLLSFIEYYIT